jgi:hydrophobic/amphiphilic exporter-1 (mainly G- bacteria), HAE1 family
MSTSPLQDGRARAVEAMKGISALCVRRPVLTVVLNLLIVVAGIAALSGVEIRELPSADRPVITVRADYPGATPETVDNQLTSQIESAVARVPGVKSISSNSRPGSSRVVVEFDPSVDINVAANDVRDAVGTVERRLPESVENLAIVKADDDADAIMRLAVTADDMPIEELTRFVERNVVDRFASVPGVADVTIYGGREPLVRVLVDPHALAFRGLSIDDLEQALSTVSLDSPAGTTCRTRTCRCWCGPTPA